MWDFPIILTQGVLKMKWKRYTKEQIISILKEHEAGASVPDLAYCPPGLVGALSKEKIRAVLDYDIPHWRDSLKTLLQQLTNHGNKQSRLT